jgi:hypothetical protein
MAGVAADVTVIGATPPPSKCQVLAAANYFIAGRGEVLAEAPVNGNPKTSVHIAIPAKPRIDVAKQPDQWRCK